MGKANKMSSLKDSFSGAETTPEQRLGMSVSDLDLSVRASNALECARIETVGQLVLYTEAHLLSKRGFGTRSLKEVKRRLGDIGLGLGTMPNNVPESTPEMEKYRRELADLRAARELGYVHTKKIAEATGYSLETVREYKQAGHIPTLGIQESKRARIRRAFYDNIGTYKKIARKVGVSPQFVRKVINEIQPKRRKNKTLEERSAEIQSLIAQGTTNVNEIAKITGLSPERVKRISYNNNLRTTGTPRNYSEKHHPEIDSLIAQGLTLEEMGTKVGVMKQRIWQYINATGQHDAWRISRKSSVCQSRQEEEQRTSLLSSLIYALQNAGLAKIADERPNLKEAYALALRYVREHPRTKAEKLEGIATLMQRYLGAQDDEFKMSLEELAEDITQFGKTKPGRVANASRILRQLGYKPMFRGAEHRHRHMSKEQKKL